MTSGPPRMQLVILAPALHADIHLHLKETLVVDRGLSAGVQGADASWLPHAHVRINMPAANPYHNLDVS